MNSPVIFITGAGKGIGEACVLSILKRAQNQFGAGEAALGSRAPGALAFTPRLFLTSRTKADLERLAQMARAQNVEVHFLARDLAEAPTEAFEACLKQYGRVDVFLHCAGVGRFGDFLELTPDDLQFTFKTNVDASFALMQAVYRQMRSQKSGLIEWITSVAAEVPFEQSAVYCMSKYAQRGLIEVMRLYARRDGIRIVEVKPGAAWTPMWGEVPAEMKARMMTAEDVAQPMIDALFVHPRAIVEELTIRPVGGDL